MSPDRRRRQWAGVVAAYVAVPALVVGLLASVLAYSLARVDVRVSGKVSLSVLTGNTFDHRLNAWSADLDRALASPQVAQAVREALGGSGTVRGLRAERLAEASEVSLVLTASGEERGQAALLAAGRTALRMLATEREQELLAQERFARQNLGNRLAAGEQLAQGLLPQDVAAERLNLLRTARQAAVDRAVADLADEQHDLAVVREVLVADPVPGVVVDDVTPLSPLGRALRTSAAGGLAAALVGAILLYARHGARLFPPRAGPRQQPAGAAGRDLPDGTDGAQPSGTGRVAAPTGEVPASA